MVLALILAVGSHSSTSLSSCHPVPEMTTSVESGEDLPRSVKSQSSVRAGTSVWTSPRAVVGG